MRTPYLVIINKDNIALYTDKRKVNKLFKEHTDEEMQVYLFKTIDKDNYWKDIFHVYTNGAEKRRRYLKMIVAYILN
jgi:hypothetical protein